MKILISALEHSANMHLKSLKKELSEDVEFIGIFDNELGNSIIDLRSLAIMGFVDAIKKLRFFFKLNSQMADLAKEADKVLLIDSSGFNLPLAKKIKKRYPDKEIIYYILPQAWAWKPKRIPVLEKTIDHLASILPFEKDYYSKTAPITYVGHPLLDIIKEYKEELNKEVKQIAFMPGSRKGEIKKLMPIFKELLHTLREKNPDIQATIIIPKHFNKEDINKLYGTLSDFKIAHNAHKTLLEADFAFICSGTATLEASLIGIPFVLTYIAKPLDYFIASKLVKLSHIGLSNIMFTQFNDRELHPEFIQEDVRVDNLAEAFNNYDRDKFLRDSKALRAYLKHGSSKTVANIIEDKNED
ncbi:MAG: lipid-A-disaccharide synthase [Sulfurimonas sp.]|uniref:lipid-A-disaccharide synthase n=1 Tax=Sulfurimonas sp. TaxID=2022749 RepID=UPI0026253F9C|nr:lipid-A-disaccharide synthase [Sulfurimonas sp.]MCW8894977.1 lipid-A-disaccharide synthase [Sulfurimonas sp.]MCW8954407.1 lipid-A-disaccharide synthase [Sulfurimonas sp.]MCW9066867.1 lipid-A-disaccharide synthase [Sulfurimonas sp.]